MRGQKLTSEQPGANNGQELMSGQEPVSGQERMSGQEI